MGMMMVLTAAEVEDRLVDAMRLWQRSPGDARWPFAGDGPWHLITREARAGGKWDAWRQLIDEGRTRKITRLPLSAADVARRDEASAWLALVPEADRGLVIAVVWAKAFGRRPDWADLLALTGRSRGQEGLRKRYVRLLSALGAAIGPVRVAA